MTVEVYNTKTFRKYVVPVHWLEHPVLGADIREVDRSHGPLIRKGKTKTPAGEADPGEAWDQAEEEEEA